MKTYILINRKNARSSNVNNTKMARKRKTCQALNNLMRSSEIKTLLKENTIKLIAYDQTNT